MITIQSNAIRGDYLYEIMDKTMKELHDDIVTVFGPYAKDAYLTQNGIPYYTRDGKETLRLTRFDNELSMYILKILYQAVQQQGNKVGDGTTSLGVLYTNLYDVIRKRPENIIGQITRQNWVNAIKDLNEEIMKYSEKMTKEDLDQMLYTCVQDADWATTISHNLGNALLNGAYITINKSNISSDFSMTVHNSPLFEATKQFSIRPLKDTENNAVILHCNGVLDIAHLEVLQNLMGFVAQDNKGNFYPKTIIILCNGLSEATRRTLKQMIIELNKIRGDAPVEDFFKNYNNIAVFTLDKYRTYDQETIEDISTIITDEKGISGLVNQLTFESLLWQTITSPGTRELIPELCTFDCDIRHLDKMRELLEQTSYQVDVDEVEGIRIHRDLGPIAQARYDALRKELDDEKSELRRLELNKRLRTSYGQFIEVEIGSKLLKDSQRKYELILDAVLSASEAEEHGILKCNSLFLAARAAHDLWTQKPIGPERLVYDIIQDALVNSITDMMTNNPNYGGYDIVHDNVMIAVRHEEYDPYLFNMKKYPTLKETLGYRYVEDDSRDDIIATGTYNDNGNSIQKKYTSQIIEPITIITTMLENSTLIYELSTARTVHIDGFIQNYI